MEIRLYIYPQSFLDKKEERLLSFRYGIESLLQLSVLQGDMIDTFESKYANKTMKDVLIMVFSGTQDEKYHE